jgi:hypothetical protein
VVSQETDVPTACEYLLDIGLDILDINSYTHPLANDVIKGILDTAQKKIQAKQDAEKKVIETKIEEQKKIYDDPRLLRAKDVAEWIFARIPIILLNAE